ncbi:hypothetical protein Tco_0701321 [Tanacetum coccineum]
MLDSEDSTVTYTAVSSPFEGLSDIESPGVDGPTMMPEDPYAYVVAAFQAPPSPDYFMPSVDEVPTKEQPLPAAVSPTPDSPGYIADSDPEEDEEDPEQDPTDYPTDRGDDDDDDDKSSDDEEDDDDDVEEDEDKEEYPAPADSVQLPVHRVIARMSIREQPPTPFWSESEIARLLAIPSPPPSPSPHVHVSPPPLPASPIYPLGYRAVMIRLRVETSSTSHPLPLSTPPLGTPPLLPIPLPTPSPHLLLPSIDCRAGVFEVTLPPRKRLCIALGLRYEVDESSSAPTARPIGGFRVDLIILSPINTSLLRLKETAVVTEITTAGAIDKEEKSNSGFLKGQPALHTLFECV